jgi:acyl-coenzyme A synthetase/AMP-(fatty) acid ligase
MSVLLLPIALSKIYFKFKPKPKESTMFRSYSPISVAVMALLVASIDIVKTTVTESIIDATGTVYVPHHEVSVMTLTLDDAEATKTVWDEAQGIPAIGDAIIQNTDGTYRLEKHADFVAHYA